MAWCGHEYTVAVAPLPVLPTRVSPDAARVHGSFFQINPANQGKILTGLVRRGPAKLTQGRSEFPTGNATTLWGSSGVSLGDGARLRTGPRVQIDRAGQRDAGLPIRTKRDSAGEHAALFFLAGGSIVPHEFPLLAEVGHIASRALVAVSARGGRAGFRERSRVFGERLKRRR